MVKRVKDALTVIQDLMAVLWAVICGVCRLTIAVTFGRLREKRQTDKEWESALQRAFEEATRSKGDV